MKAAHDFFIKEHITNFPIDPIKIIKKNKWGLMTYTELADLHGMSIEMIIKAFQSEDGYVIKDNDNYTIAYNDAISIPGRIRFTLMHEIGHIYLNHLVDFKETMLKRSKLTQSKYVILEREANAFARNTLVPPEIANRIKTERSILAKPIFETYFEITHRAAETRLIFLNWDLKHAKRYSDFYVKRFGSFIHEIIYGSHCARCGGSFVAESANFCPICGNNHLEKGMGDRKMIYDGYEVDDNGRALICPRCSNEELDYIGDFCKVCGSTIVNKCTKEIYYEDQLISDCGTIAEGNARHCRKCGEETTFYKQQFLKPWRVAQEELRNEIEEEEQAEINEMIGEELPF